MVSSSINFMIYSCDNPWSMLLWIMYLATPDNRKRLNVPQAYFKYVYIKHDMIRSLRKGQKTLSTFSAREVGTQYNWLWADVTESITNWLQDVLANCVQNMTYMSFVHSWQKGLRGQNVLQSVCYWFCYICSQSVVLCAISLADVDNFNVATGLYNITQNKFEICQ